MRRPIVFVCHSLGGIIAKKALLLGVSGEQAKVQDAVYGVVFLATPHNGSNIATCGKIIANIVTACSPLNPAKRIIGALQKDSKVLLEITEDFVPRTSTLQLVSFFEMKMTSIGFYKTMIVEQDSAILHVPNEVVIGQNADHREIARFDSLHDRNFRPVLSRLEVFRQDIINQLQSTASSRPAREGLGTISTHALFEIPFSPCNTFQGREVLLGQMEAFFHTSSAPIAGQLTFAICGLGGSGKTQAALKFATRNRDKYPSGVFFVSASSEPSQAANVSQICESLKLGNVSNKASSFNEWLSRVENTDWLLIFDNADDLESVRIAQYFPDTSWGHIVVTSRDQGVIGNVTKDGAVLNRLEVGEAIVVLLQKAGYLSPSAEHYEEAKMIVELLGCLPLAVDQAGAYIRSRRKTLTSYRRLYKDRQNNILKFKPRLGEYDNTVFTTWDINFEQVERDSKEASMLLLLFCFLDASNISETMLDRACSPQKRWNRIGEMSELAPIDAGLNNNLIALIKDEVAFDDAIEKLLSFSLIHLDNDVNGLRNFSVHPLIQHCASQRVPLWLQDQWRLQAILVVCHAFPRNKYLEPLYGDLGRSRLPHVVRILKEYDQLAERQTYPASVKDQLSSMLLATSRFSSTSWKRGAINRVKQLLQDSSDAYLKVCLAQRESSLLRMLGEGASSDKTLEEFVHSTILPGYDQSLEGDARWNAQRGELILSFAENLIANDALTVARRELLQWKPIDPRSSSSMERIVLRGRNIILGKILKFQGHFQEAVEVLDAVLQESKIDSFYEGTGWRRVLLCNLGDLYCELQRPADAQLLLEPEFRQMVDSSSQNISSGRRIQLTLAESYVRSGMYEKAEEILTSLAKLYGTIDDPDSLAKSGIFRVWASLARIAHVRCCWDEALFNWNKACSALQSLGRPNHSHSGLVQYAIAHALSKLGKIQESSDVVAKARYLLSSDGRMYWIVGFDSYWRDYIVEGIEKTLSAS
ncbi:MAG: hypothetical protein Q9210_006126 [Variospora velana]